MVSVIIPAFNCERYLREAVESAVGQTFTDIEIIIINDASTDGTAALAEILASEYMHVRVFGNEQNIGVAATRNLAISLSSGDYIAFLDADDRWLPDKLERQLHFVRLTGVDVCYTAYSFIDGYGNSIRSPYRVPTITMFKRMLFENVIGLSSALVKRESLGDILMRCSYAHEDYVLWLELLQKGCTFGGINEPLMEYRISDSNRSGNKVMAAKNRWRIYRQFLNLSLFQAGYAFAGYAIRGVFKHM